MKAIITGGSRGLGRSVAHALADKGWSCTLISKTPETLRTAASQLPHPERHSFVPIDLSQPSAIAPALQPLLKDEIHLLVNCAGITDRSLLVSTPDSLIEQVIATNLTASLVLSKLVARSMVRRKVAGNIINVSSVLAERPTIGSAAYIASKAGLVGLTKALALELSRKNIRCNAILPGYMDTDMGRSIEQQPADLLKGDVLADVVDTVLFLASHESITGATLTVDNGISIR